MQRVRQTTTVKKSYAVIGIIPFVVERRGRKHTATVLADGTVFIIPKKTAEAVFLFALFQYRRQPGGDAREEAEECDFREHDESERRRACDDILD